MESLLRNEFGLKGEHEDVCKIRWSISPWSMDINQFVAAYDELRGHLVGLERENNSIRRKLRSYEVKFPMISVMQDNGSFCCSWESDELEKIQKENSSLQQRINNLVKELQESKAHEQRLEQVIKTFKKIHMEKSNMQTDLDKMTTLAEQHVERIRKLEEALGQRDILLQKKRSRETSHHRHKDTHYLHLYTSLDAPCELDCLSPSLQSSRSLDTLTDLRVQRLEVELEGAWHEAEGACQREAELKTELQRLQEEIRQETQRQELDAACKHCSVEWIKKAGDEQVNLAIAYTELMEELNRIRTLISHQNKFLHQNLSRPEPKSPVLRHSPASPPSDPASLPHHSMRSHFQGHRSYSDIADPTFSPQRIHTPVSTLPKRRPSDRAHLRPLSALPCPSSAHGALQLSYQPPVSAPATLETPPQSSDDEEELFGFRIMMPPPHLSSEHAQSWPSIKLWMELEGGQGISCPLCQLSFPTGFPDDVLITHIETHLENSKI